MIKEVLFWTFWAIFVATAFVTILAMIGKVRIKPEFLKKLFYVLIVEVIGAIVMLFSHLWLEDKESEWEELPSYKVAAQFYTSIREKNYGAAYDLLSTDSRIKRKVTRDLFIEGYNDTVSVRLLSILPQSTSGKTTHDYIAYYIDEVETPVVSELKDIHRLRVRDIDVLSAKLSSLKERVSAAQLPAKTIDDLTFEQVFAPNRGDKISFLLKRDSGLPADHLFPEHALRKSVSGYLI